MTSKLVLAIVLASSVVLSATGAAKAPADPQSGRLDKLLDAGNPPQTVDDLKAMQDRFRAVARQVLPCTVGVWIGGRWGSGVIVSEDGYVLTAGHVVAQPGREVSLLIHDGRRVKGKTLGANFGIDAGMVKITSPGPWPHCEIGDSKAVKLGAWCLATGHPAGYHPGRTPPVRVGRILAKHARGLVSDCMLVGGDSGGPLFDMHARVIGIHSRIGGTLRANVHVPADTFRQTWDRLAKGEAWGRRTMGPRPGGPYIGVVAAPQSDKATVMAVQPASPAATAGIQPGDVIVKFAGKPVKDFPALAAAVRARKPGDKVALEVLRAGKALTLELTIGTFGKPAP